jgi:hypothetical protein
VGPPAGGARPPPPPPPPSLQLWRAAKLDSKGWCGGAPTQGQRQPSDLNDGDDAPRLRHTPAKVEMDATACAPVVDLTEDSEGDGEGGCGPTKRQWPDTLGVGGPVGPPRVVLGQVAPLVLAKACIVAPEDSPLQALVGPTSGRCVAPCRVPWLASPPPSQCLHLAPQD